MSETMTSIIPTPNNDRPRRQALGLVVLLLTLGAGYGVAKLDVRPSAELAELEEAEAEAERRGPTLAEIMEQIHSVANRHRVPPRLVAAIVAVESEFNPRAVSRRGAQGLMQLMPATAAHLDVQDSFDARENIEGGVRHLRVLMDRYHNDLPLVLAAYNAGDRAVLAYGGVPPYRETRRYVIRVLRRYDQDAARAAARRIYAVAPSASPVSRPRLAFEGVATPAVLRFPAQLEPVRELVREPEPLSRPVESSTKPMAETP
jgi:hypothetical protein